MAQPCLSVQDVLYLNQLGRLQQVPFARNRVEMDLQIETNISKPTEPFKKPMVVEVIGAGFDKPPHAAFFTLRFP